MVNTEYDDASLLASLANAVKQEKRDIQASGHRLSAKEELLLEFNVLSEVFTCNHFLHYAGWFYPVRKNEFLATYYWRVVRTAVLIECNRQCQVTNCSRQACDVHHLDYSICGQEHLFMDCLAGLCKHHHTEQHRDTFRAPDRFANLVLQSPNFRTTSPGSPLCFSCHSENKKSVAQWLYSQPNGEDEIYVNTTENLLVCSQCHDILIHHGCSQSRFFSLTDMQIWDWINVLYSYVDAEVIGKFYGLKRTCF